MPSVRSLLRRHVHGRVRQLRLEPDSFPGQACVAVIASKRGQGRRSYVAGCGDRGRTRATEHLLDALM
jgi:hypothetical protein